MDKFRNQLKYAAIGLFVMCIVDLIVYLLPSQISYNLTLNTITVFLFIGLEAWAFLMLFKIASKGSMLQKGSIIAFVYVALCVVNWVWFLISPSDMSRYYIAYIPQYFLIIIAMVFMFSNCKNSFVSITGWAFIVIKLVYILLFISRVEWLSEWVVMSIVMVSNLLFAAFLYGMSMIEGRSVSDTDEEKTDNVGTAASPKCIVFPRLEDSKISDLTWFDFGAILMSILAILGLTTLEEINDSIFDYAENQYYPLIYSFFTFLSLAGVFCALSRIYRMNGVVNSISSNFKEYYGRDISGISNVPLLSLGGLAVLVGVLSMFLESDVSSREEFGEGAWFAIVSPLAFQTKLVFDIICIGGMLMALGWLLKVKDVIKALKVYIPQKYFVVLPTTLMVVLIIVAIAAGALFIYLFIDSITDEKYNGWFGNYFVHLSLSSFSFAAVSMLLYYVMRFESQIKGLMKMQPEVLLENTKPVEEK